MAHAPLNTDRPALPCVCLPKPAHVPACPALPCLRVCLPARIAKNTKMFNVAGSVGPACQCRPQLKSHCLPLRPETSDQIVHAIRPDICDMSETVGLCRQRPAIFDDCCPRHAKIIRVLTSYYTATCAVAWPSTHHPLNDLVHVPACTS